MTTEHENTRSDIQDDTIDLATETLTGDIRDFLIDRVKALGKPWAAMTEDEQRDQIHAATNAAGRLVRRAVTIIAANGRKAMVGVVDTVTFKDGIKAVIKVAKSDEQRHALADSQGQTVLIVVADAEPFIGENAPAEPEPDQPDLLDDTGEPEAEDETDTENHD